MAIRDCAWRHGRLPEEIIVDGGPEFHSIHFTVLLASLNVTRSTRPPEDPRFGKEVERLFGAFKECFARGLPGFTPGVAYDRKISGSHHATKRAKLHLHDLIGLLEEYTFNRYNHEPKPGHLESRSELGCQSQKMFPFSGRPVDVDIRFLIQTSVEAPAKAYEFKNGRGVRVYGLWYCSQALFDYKGPKKDVSVKIEPFDNSIVYVCISGFWHVCRNTSSVIHGALPTREVMELTRQHQDLRSLSKALALEAQQSAYESKKASVGLILADAKTNSKSVPFKSRRDDSDHNERPASARSFDDIDDLVMDEDQT